MVVRILSELSENIHSMQKDTETIKNELVRNEGNINWIKNNLEGINNRVDEAKKQISNLEYKKAKQTNKQTTQPG